MILLPFSAVVVRYLTKRYLSEYAHTPEMIYERVVAVSGKQVPIKITDFSGKVRLYLCAHWGFLKVLVPNLLNWFHAQFN